MGQIGAYPICATLRRTNRQITRLSPDNYAAVGMS